MLYKPAFCLAALLCLALTASYGQSVDTLTGKLAKFPSRVFSRIGSQSASLNQQVTNQTQHYLSRMGRQEARMQKKLAAVDSNAAKTLFAGSQQQYAALAAQIKSASGNRKASINGQYQPNADTLQGAMTFLQQHPQLLAKPSSQTPSQLAQVSPEVLSRLQGATTQFQTLQDKLQDADAAKAFVQQRQQQIGDYISQHANLQNVLGKDYGAMGQSVYYYSQQVQQYKAMLDNPDLLAQKALAMLSQLPAFQSFMDTHSQLGGLFHLPANYASPQSLNGLQTKDQVAKLVQGQVSPGGAGKLGGAGGEAGGSAGAGVAALQSNLQSAQSQLDTYKSKLSQLGGGNADMPMPDFKPNDQKTKTFLKRLQYGFNFQTTRNSYYFPTGIDLGGSLGYQLGHSNVVGVGASFKLGVGNGINDIAFSGQGVGLRSFLNIKIKGTFSATGGFEYNYTTPFTTYQQLRQIDYWTKSGLIGITKTVSMKSKLFKQTTLSLLWDFLSYSQAPPTQPILFRVGYTF